MEIQGLPVLMRSDAAMKRLPVKPAGRDQVQFAGLRQQLDAVAPQTGHDIRLTTAQPKHAYGLLKLVTDIFMNEVNPASESDPAYRNQGLRMLNTFLKGDYIPLDIRDSKKPGRVFHILEDKNTGEVLGSASLYKEDHTPAGVGTIGYTYLKPSLRGHGIGTLLLNDLIGKARKAGYQSLTMTTRGKAHDEVIALFKQAGFQELAFDTPRRRELMPPDFDSPRTVVMEKQL